MMKVSILSFFLAVATADQSSAFVPPTKLAGLRPSPFFSTKPQTITTTEDVVTLNEEKFLADMDQDLSNLIQADPAYITEARLRFAALADEAEELQQQYGAEIANLRSKSVWDSFESVKKTTTTTFGGETTKVETTESNNGGALIGLALAAAAVAVTVDPAAVNDFLSNIDLDLQLPAVDLSGIDWNVELSGVNLDVDLSGVQTQVQDLVASSKIQLEGLQSSTHILAEEWQTLASAGMADMSSKAQDWMASASGATSQWQQSVQDALAGSQGTLQNLQGQMDASTAQLQEAIASSQVNLAQAQQGLAALGSDWKDAVMNFQKDSLEPGLGNLAATAQLMLTNVQEQASLAFKSMDADLKGVQEGLANADWEGSVPSMLTSAGEDLKALLRQ